MDEFLTIPGYLPTKQAAQRVGVCEERILQLAHAGRLPYRVIGRNYLFPESAISLLRRKPHGNIRTRPVPWRKYRAGAVVYVRRIDAPILPGMDEALTAHFYEMAESQQHLFPGTMSRFVSVDEGELSVLLMWKTTEADETRLARDVETFKAEIAPFVDWGRARDVVSKAMAHT